MTVLIFDTERTDRDNGEIIEAAWLRLPARQDLAGTIDLIPTDLQPTDGFSSRYKPTKPITFGSMAVHHILPSELADCAPSSEFALPADCAYLIGHSIDFDWQAAGSPPAVKRIDTHGISQWLWPDVTGGHSQSAVLYAALGPTPETRELLAEAHSALADAWNNFRLLREIMRLKPEIQTWSALWEYSEQCRVPRTCPLKRYQGVLLGDLDDGFIDWCLGQSWLDPYFRKGLERVVAERAESYEPDYE